MITHVANITKGFYLSAIDIRRHCMSRCFTSHTHCGFATGLYAKTVSESVGRALGFTFHVALTWQNIWGNIQSCSVYMNPASSNYLINDQFKGIISAWQAVMVMNFSPLGVSESEVGFIGFVATVVYCGVSPIIAALMDRVKKHFKSMLVFLCVVSTICFAWLWLLCLQVTT